ncbi:hypothetical protein ACQPTN_07685 [Bradyrhizobium sp. 13971]
MDWVGIIVVAACFFFLGRVLRPQNKAQGPTLSRSGLSSASDRDIMLATFRRELANYLVRYDPDRFLQLCSKAHGIETKLKTADKAVREAELLLITNKYPNYEDFDLVGTRAHVLYADGFSSFPVEDIEEHFLNLVKFHALQRADNTDWQFRGDAISDKDVEHLQGYVRKIKDTRFLQRLKATVADFYSHRAPLDGLPTDYQVVYETPSLAVYRLPHIAEVRHGFHFKELQRVRHLQRFLCRQPG